MVFQKVKEYADDDQTMRDFAICCCDFNYCNERSFNPQVPQPYFGPNRYTGRVSKCFSQRTNSEQNCDEQGPADSCYNTYCGRMVKQSGCASDTRWCDDVPDRKCRQLKDLCSSRPHKCSGMSSQTKECWVCCCSWDLCNGRQFDHVYQQTDGSPNMPSTCQKLPSPIPIPIQPEIKKHTTTLYVPQPITQKPVPLPTESTTKPSVPVPEEPKTQKPPEPIVPPERATKKPAVPVPETKKPAVPQPVPEEPKTKKPPGPSSAKPKPAHPSQPESKSQPSDRDDEPSDTEGHLNINIGINEEQPGKGECVSGDKQLIVFGIIVAATLWMIVGF